MRRNRHFVEVPGDTPMERFENAVRQIAKVSHEEMQVRIDAAKDERDDRVAARQRLLARRRAVSLRRSASDRASDKKA